MTPCRCSFVFNPAGLRWAGFAPRPNPAEDGPSRPRSAPPHGLEGGQPWRQERYGPWLGRQARLGPARPLGDDNDPETHALYALLPPASSARLPRGA